MNLLANLLKNYKIILASQSPRRMNLLKSLGLDFEIIPANIDESSLKETEPSAYCKKLSLDKAQFVSKITNSETTNSKIIKMQQNTLIIAADTIVVLNDEIINKPVSEEDAFIILKKLSGNSHFVYTGVTVLNSATSKAITNYSLTRVYFRELSDSEILDYISSGSPMDKAGAYGIQDDYGALFVKRIEGCYNNVIGLPLELMFRILLEAIN